MSTIISWLFLVQLSALVLVISEPNPLQTVHFQGSKHSPWNSYRPIMCAPDSLMMYQDCRLCVCPRPNKIAKCSRKLCDRRDKNTGQCPMAVLWIDYSQLCPEVSHPDCKTDLDCPGNQLCCFDFCNEWKCKEPVPLGSHDQPKKGAGRHPREL